MSVLFLVFMTIISGVLTLFSWLGVSEGQCKRWVAILIALWFGTSIAWAFGSVNQPNRVEVVETLPVKTIAGANGPMQVVVYQDADGETKFLNFHKQFGCQAAEGTMVRHTRFARGPYCGLYYERQWGLSDRWEVVVVR